MKGNAEIDLSVQGEISKGKIPTMNGNVVLNGVTVKLAQFPAPLTDLRSQINFYR